MDNQQPSILEERIYLLAKNATFGDGHLWKHPECVNAKAIYTSTTPELLEVKYNLAKEIFATGVTPFNTKRHTGRFSNSKQMYRLASLVHPTFTKVKEANKEDLFSTLTLEDFGLWYLDDGCAVERKDTKNPSYRFYLSIGDCCETTQRQEAFESQLRRLFGKKYGSIQKNNSKATPKNKSWIIPKHVAKVILAEASKYRVLQYKIPSL